MKVRVTPVTQITVAEVRPGDVIKNPFRKSAEAEVVAIADGMYGLVELSARNADGKSVLSLEPSESVTLVRRPAS